MINDIALPQRPYKDAATTYEWLGSLWTTLYQDQPTIYGYCKGSSLAAAQSYLNFLEVVNSYSRQDIPLFHRKIWTPLLIRKSQQDLGNKIVCGVQPPVTVGPQPEDTAYQPKVVYKVGGNVVRHSFVTYPFASSAPVAAGMTRIASTIVDPGSVYIKGTHYYVQGAELIFRQESDPFEDPSFLRREFYNEDIDAVDEEILLWATDIQIDVDMLYNNYGYQVAFKTESGEYYLDALNSLWDVRYQASNLTAVRRSIGALLGVATTGDAEELVEDVVENDDGSTTIITNADVYTALAAETLRPEVVAGNTLDAGTFLTDTIHYYVKLDPERFAAGNRLSLSEFLLDVPSLRLSNGVANNGIQGSLNCEWRPTPIIFRGNDANGNPKLQFELGGSEADFQQFWQSIWDRAESKEESLGDFFSPYLWSTPPYVTPDRPVGEINPMRFFMENFFKYNVGIVVVDFNALPDYIKSLSVFANLNRLLPAHAVLTAIGKQSISDSSGFSASETLASNPGKALNDTVSVPNEAGLQTRWVSV
jgi:hypothetical protein